MPGRLLSLVRAAPSSSKFDTFKSHHNSSSNSTSSSSPSQAKAPSTGLLPPYSVEDPSTTQRPSANRTKSNESIVMDAFKRHSLGVRHHSDKKHPKSPKVEPQKAAKLSMVVESPPVMFFNSPSTSTGAIISGQLMLDVTEPHISLDKFEMRLLAICSTKKPVSQHCADCTKQTTEIHKWEFLTHPTSLRHGVHQRPFSHLLPGHLPATTHGNMASLDYVLSAVATTSNGDKITLQRDMPIMRAIVPGPDKNSIRIFPPTNLTAAVTLPPVIHPIGDFPVEMRLSGIVVNKDDSQTRWKLRKLNWRIEETQKFIAPACAKHANKIGGEGKGIQHEDSHVIASEEVKTGWKTDFENGNIDVEFRAAPNNAQRPLCDMTSPNGMEVKHNLIIEMVVAEEWAPLKKLSQATPTGAARVLRTQFHLIMTERAGMGISWDEEQPPLYDDVPASPPTYQNVTIADYDGSSLSDEEQLHL
ncbi:hypothetical protein BU24DRAFT_412933 [Aaosphaeria arxii CBS 175.79]|uniref:LDB19 N-terminal domain-containing protein n=1 Tax=Aaosphaeria arxii CBS 175.79 TaxID=1450172 RepID=A0A6A5XED7_9PLEO|nr:uncharacterized protein BU24DRAFT_412933 [Aaosphaeria arxii CBS 175.79]KAF2011249.1 hypothetical protein BU24DRAFT_412933 [Aaosphaeria arxii CBS 175.79]